MLSRSLCSSLIHASHYRIYSWRGYHRLITAGEVTETWTSPAALPHCATGEVGAGLLEGKALVICLFQQTFKHRRLKVRTSGKENASHGRCLLAQCVNCWEITTHKTSVADNIIIYLSSQVCSQWYKPGLGEAVFLVCYVHSPDYSSRWP